jgi:hypothetical protein
MEFSLMAAIFEQESPHRVVARISGKLSPTELQAFQEQVAPLFKASGDMRFMVILEEFEGWEKGRGWEDVGFTDAHDDYLSKFAIVGDEAWRDQVLMFTLAGLRPVDIRYFSTADEAAARAWLAE